VDLNCLTSGCTGRSPAARAGEPYTLPDMRAVALGLALACAAPSYAGEESYPELTHLMVGAWRSFRHDYVYLADGTWWMGKPEPNGPEPQVTHGHWWIKDHRLCETVYLQGEGLRDKGCEPINKLTAREILFGGVYRMKRIDLNQVDQ
jgi:hypothetical protein